MYTLSMRPDVPTMVTSKCINFEQERSSWELANFVDSKYDEASASVLGLYLYTPLSNVDITVSQFAAMVAGVEKAYVELCGAVWKEAPKALASTPYKTLEMFMDCIPRGLFVPPSKDTSTPMPVKEMETPLLYDQEEGVCYVWESVRWERMEPPVGIESYETAGTCFGLEVRYQLSVAESKLTPSGITLCDCIGKLLSKFGSVDTDAKLYTANLYSVR